MHNADALSRAYLKTTDGDLKTTDGAQTEFCEIRALETVDHEEHIKLNHRNKTFSINKLLRIVISRNLSVLSSQDGLKGKNAPLLSNHIMMSEVN